MNLHKLFIVHALILATAGLVLIIAPAMIPATVGLQLKGDQYLLSYFLAAAEIALAYLSWSSRGLKDPRVLRQVVLTMLIFHLVTALLEFTAWLQGTTVIILINVFARLLVSTLFYYYGIVKQPD